MASITASAQLVAIAQEKLRARIRGRASANHGAARERIDERGIAKESDEAQGLSPIAHATQESPQAAFAAVLREALLAEWGEGLRDATQLDQLVSDVLSAMEQDPELTESIRNVGEQLLRELSGGAS